MKKLIETVVLGLTRIIGISAQMDPSCTELTINMELVNEMVIPSNRYSPT